VFPVSLARSPCRTSLQPVTAEQSFCIGGRLAAELTTGCDYSPIDEVGLKKEIRPPNSRSSWRAILSVFGKKNADHRENSGVDRPAIPPVSEGKLQDETVPPSLDIVTRVVSVCQSSCRCCGYPMVQTVELDDDDGEFQRTWTFPAPLLGCFECPDVPMRAGRFEY